MAQGDITFPNGVKKGLLDGLFDMDTGGNTYRIILLNNAFVPNIDTHITYANVSANEYGAGAGYTVGGETLAGQATTQDNTNDRGEWDANDVTWTNLGPLADTPSYAAIYDDTDASDTLVCFIEIGVAPNGANFTIQWDAEGIFAIA